MIVRFLLSVWMIVMCAVLLIGCWDRVEVDERAFIVGVAVDVADSGEGGEEPPGAGQEGMKYLVTYQFVVPSSLSGNVSGGPTYYNLKGADYGMDALTAMLASKSSRIPFFEHLKVIVISEQVAKTGASFADMFDFFIRDNEARRTVKLMMTVNNNAREVLEVNSPMEKIPSLYIDLIAENSKTSARMLEESRLGEVYEFMLKSESFLIQQVRVSKNLRDATISGASIIDGHTNRLIGTLNEDQTVGVNFFKGKIKGGVLNAAYENRLVSYEIERVKRSLRAEVRDRNQITFHLHIHTEGVVGEIFDQPNLLDEAIIRGIEHSIAKEIKRTVDHAVSVLQNKYKRDVLGLGNFLYRKHYPVWTGIQDDWERGEQLFCRAKIEVNVDVNVRRMGSVIHSERRG